MRVIPVNLTSKALRAALSDLRTTLRIPDRGYLEDLFCLIRRKGLGIPDAKLLQKICRDQAKSNGLSPALTLMMGKSRVRTLRTIVESTLFKQTYLAQDPIGALKMYLHASISLGLSLQKTKCAMCNLNTSCKFYAKYKNLALSSLNSASKSDVKLLVPDACPDKPTLDTSELNEAVPDPVAMGLSAGAAGGSINAGISSSLNQAAQTTANVYNPFDLTEDELVILTKADQLAQKDSGLLDKASVDAALTDSKYTGGGKLSAYYDADHTGIPAMSFNQVVIEQLSTSAAPFLTLAQKLEALVRSLSSTKFKPSPEITPKYKEKQIKQVSEAVGASMITHALPSDIFSAKVAKKDIHINKYEKPDERQKAFYIVLDFSISMHAELGRVGGIALSRSAVASAFALAMLERVMSEGGVFFLRGFANAPDSSMIYVNAKEPDAELRYAAARNYILACDYTGSGTRIDLAIETAAWDIDQAKGKNKLLSEAEIMLITDADDSSLERPDIISSLRLQLKDVAMNVIDVAPLESYPDRFLPRVKTAKAALESLSDNYHLAQHGALNLESLVNCVGGKKNKVVNN